jgi:hypothetical protein
VCTLGAKLLYDRVHRPRVWIKTAAYDPDLPIRGRYLSLRLEVPAEGFTLRSQPSLYLKDKDGKPLIQEFLGPDRADLALRDAQLVAIANADGEYWVNAGRPRNAQVAVINTHTAYFLPEHSVDPSRRPAGEELWIEATIPRKGPPRPIRLGVKKNGVLSPLPVQ